ncbi:hypothetical protein ACFX13_023508 [Malus domestica]
MNNLSFSSHQPSSGSVCSFATEACLHSSAHKPQKANQAAWEAMIRNPMGGLAAVLLCHENGGQRSTCYKKEVTQS